MKTINSKVVKPFKQTPIKSLKLLTIASALAVQTACMSTNPMMGGSDSTVTGAAGGANASENNTALENAIRHWAPLQYLKTPAYPGGRITAEPIRKSVVLFPYFA